MSDITITENVIDHQIHSGSNAYSIALTDQGNIHIHDIFTEHEDAYRGTIQVTRGSQKILIESTGLYLAVLSPSSNTMTFEMCEEPW